MTCHVTAAIWNIKKFPNPDQEQNSNTSSLDHAHSLTLPYLTFGAGTDYYTCPALRPYQFDPVRNPDVTEGHSDRLWSRKFTSHLALVTCSMVVLTIWSALSTVNIFNFRLRPNQYATRNDAKHSTIQNTINVYTAQRHRQLSRKVPLVTESFWMYADKPTLCCVLRLLCVSLGVRFLYLYFLYVFVYFPACHYQRESVNESCII